MISPEKFYGGITVSQRKIDALIRKSPLKKRKPLPAHIASLLGPSHTWKIFRKQHEAIQFSRNRGCGLMAFAFQHSGGQRSFLVCHPILFWFHYSQRQDKDKSTYEIIQENAHCKLYLDVEFEYEFNRAKTFKQGVKMLDTFLTILQRFLSEILSIDCREDWFLDLDSSTNSKFSRHVILNIPGSVFENNLTVGNVVKAVCSQITDHLQSSKALYEISSEELSTLMVTDRKGLHKLMIDQSVYTKNRHFRILGSTKLHKNAPLTVTRRNQFKEESSDALFLSSLITHCEEGRLKIIQYGRPAVCERKLPDCRRTVRYSTSTTTLYDDFINSVIAPLGIIRQKIEQGKRIKYEIANYRFCSNIGREHKSNNISLIIDTMRLTIYQTCYDPDCKEFTSQEKQLPPELCLAENDETLLVVANEIIDQNFGNLLKNDLSPQTPDVDISDQLLLMIAEATEGIEIVN